MDGARPSAATGGPPDRRRQILDASVRVFARHGYHGSRVSDIADEAGVAHGLLYHYFRSKNELLDTLFAERWELMLDAIRAAGAGEGTAHAKLDDIAGFIVGSYRHDPALMKVIIVEVTRAANSFGRTHLEEIRRAFGLLAEIVAAGQRSGELRTGVDPLFAAMAFYGVVEQTLTAWIFDEVTIGEDEADRARAAIVGVVCGGLVARRGV